MRWAASHTGSSPKRHGETYAGTHGPSLSDFIARPGHPVDSCCRSRAHRAAYLSGVDGTTRAALAGLRRSGRRAATESTRLHLVQPGAARAALASRIV